MPQVSYSPPPWRTVTIYDEMSYSIRDVNRRLIGVVAVPSNLSVAPEEAGANRHIIEAAPDTLLACEVALEVLRSGREVTPRIIAGLEAAINKAYGRVEQ